MKKQVDGGQAQDLQLNGGLVPENLLVSNDGVDDGEEQDDPQRNDVDRNVQQRLAIEQSVSDRY